MNDSFRILIVEDELSSRKLLEKILISAGFEVVSVKNGLEALEILEKVYQFTGVGDQGSAAISQQASACRKPQGRQLYSHNRLQY